MEINQEFKQAWDLIEHQKTNLFLTGKAGTGKSTFLRYLEEHTEKSVAIIAPTGVAALNVGGQTIHSFFQFSTGVLQKDDIHFCRNAKIIQHLDMLVIDEISMVRVDLIDAIDLSLKLHRGNTKPFGGVQVVIIGDMCQLPAIVAEKEVEAFLTDKYGGFYFFLAKVFQENPIQYLEFSQVYRQKDPVFLDILNHIRENTITEDVLSTLNMRCVSPQENEIILTSMNITAQKRNQECLAKIPQKQHTFLASITGEFDQSVFPTDERLELKVGAQIMMVRNDSEKRWVNGTLGTVHKCGLLGITVNIDGSLYDVEPHTWEKIRYEYNQEEKKITRLITGTFTQYPLRLAWAVTIHKCIAEGTLISTNKGLVPIEAIKMGDHVVTSSGQVHVVTLASHIGNRSILTIVTRGRRTIRCTPEHKIFIERQGKRQWIEAQNIIPGDLLITQAFCDTGDYYLTLPPVRYQERCGRGRADKKITCPSILDEDLAWWLGVLIGDGSYADRKEGGFWISASSSEVRERFAKITSGWGLHVGQRKTSKAELFFNSNPLRNWLFNLGIDYVLAPDKRIPPDIFRSRPSVRAAFLQGLFDTDGSAKRGRIIFTTTSKLIVDGIHLILDSLGIEARKFRPQPSSCIRKGERIYTGKTKYQLKISSHSEPQFMRFVGFTRSDRNQDWASKKWSFDKSNKSSLIPYTDEVCEISSGGTSEVYDLEVESEHNFYANGILVSNSQGKTFERVRIEFGRKGAFAPGQTYVALSRCTSLNGLTLARPLTHDDFLSDPKALEYTQIFRKVTP